MKKIVICGKEYNIECTAFTRYEYNKYFDSKLFQDIKKLQALVNKQRELTEIGKEKGLSEEEINVLFSEGLMDYLDDFIDVITRITFIFIHTANPEIKDFDEWLKGFKKIDLNEGWIGEVTDYAVTSFL